MAKTAEERRQKSKPWKKPEMVDWYAPVQLTRTGLSTLVSTILGEQIDTRLLGAEGKPGDSIFDYSQLPEVGFDFAADTGDGWASTYTLAYLLSHAGLAAGPGPLPRADFVVLGGDEVYPVANSENYARRLVWPFNQACRDLGIAGDQAQLRDIYLVPGNHDWYDSLAAFNRRFCNGRWMGAFRTRQKRSYFALKLPHDWHLWAVDIQLGDDIDVRQFDFFRELAKTLTSQSKVILLSAEPETVYGARAPEKLRFTIARFDELVEKQGARVALKLAGDVHNYQRYEGERRNDDLQLTYPQTQLVAGGGGAFLHPNHGFTTAPEDAEGFHCRARYPEEKTSRRLCWGNVFFALRHKGMSLFLGLLYVMMFWAVPEDPVWRRFPLEHAFSSMVALVTFGGLVLFAKSVSTRKSFLGVVHGLAHLAAAYFSWRWGAELSATLLASFSPGGELGTALDLYLPKVLQLFVGGAIGGTLFGLYLLVALNVFSIHHNEAFSSLAIPHYKHFLRCRVGPDGKLTVHVVAIPKVASDKDAQPVPIEVVETVTVT